MKKATLVAAFSLAATVASAQVPTPRPLELGIDAGVTIGLGDNTVTTIDIPVSAFRVGFPISPRTSLEPKLTVHIATGNDVTITSYRGEVGLLYHLGSDRYPGAYQRAGLYVRPFLGIVGASVGGSVSKRFRPAAAVPDMPGSTSIAGSPPRSHSAPFPEGARQPDQACFSEHRNRSGPAIGSIGHGSYRVPLAARDRGPFREVLARSWRTVHRA